MIAEEDRINDGKISYETVYHILAPKYTPGNIYSALRATVLGQDEALRQVSILLAAYLRSVNRGSWDNKYNFMLVGDSGSGKTTIIKAIQRVLDVLPSAIVDASLITQAGFRGLSANQIFTPKMIESRCGIVFLDEIDKLLKPSFDSHGVNVSIAVQNNLLKMLDGDPIYTDEGQQIETERILFVGCGAFADIKGKEEKQAKIIGFERKEAALPTIEETDYQLGHAEIAKYGGNEQLIGRFLQIIRLNPPNIELYREIMRQAEWEIRRLFPLPKRLLTEDEADEIIKSAMDENTFGCRGIRSNIWNLVLSKYTERILADTQERQPAGLSDEQCRSILKAARSA